MLIFENVFLKIRNIFSKIKNTLYNEKINKIKWDNFMKRQGSALIMVTTLAALLITTAILISVNSVSDIDITGKEKARIQLELACKSGLERAKNKIEESFNNSNLTRLEPYVSFQDNDVDDSGKTAVEKAYDDENFASGSPGDYLFTYSSDETDHDIYVQYAITEDNDENGWERSSKYTVYKMKIESIAYAPGIGWIGMTENAYARRTTLFMYQVFFENTLEILPGPDFELTGLIHTNEDLYLNSNNSLNIYTDSLSSAGEIFRGRLDRSEIGGTINITRDNINGSLVEMEENEDSENSDWIQIASDNWGGTVKDKHLGASRQEAPQVESFEPGGYYDQNSGIKIEVLTSGSDPSYKITYDGYSHTYTSSELNGALTETEVYDYREYPSGSNPENNTPVKVTNVDINRLKNELSYYPDNGLIYMTRDDAVPDNDGDDFATDPNRNVTGFKLINNTSLPAPTTFVSNLPVYLHGSYNTVDWQPSAVIADSITLLSDNYNDSMSNWKDTSVNPGGSMPDAVSSEFNLAFITGNLPTQSGQYNGGLENYPRLLENWSGEDLTISGSFIQLFRSQYATGQWSYGDYYTAPARNWSAEEKFSDLNDLPPGYINLFPSVNIGIIYSNWRQISKDEAEINEAY